MQRLNRDEALGFAQNRSVIGFCLAKALFDYQRLNGLSKMLLKMRFIILIR